LRLRRAQPASAEREHACVPRAGTPPDVRTVALAV
jgi:hypothetical protein